MSGYRLKPPYGSAINRQQVVEFSFNGKTYQGLAGDTLASALLANGVRHVGRSYKLHRPRGIFTCGAEEPTGLLEVGTGSTHTPNTRATDVALSAGMVARSGNCWPSLGFDVAAVNDKFSGLLPAGFYYKTFIWPSWHLFEPSIRRMAAGSHAPDVVDSDRYDSVSWDTDVVVVGAGPSGQAVARAAADGGARVILITAGALPDDTPLQHARITVLKRTTAVGYYDHHLVTAVEVTPSQSVARERLHKIRARSVVLATGCFERPMVFPDNDRPGVMLATAVLRYATQYGVACGRRVVVSAASDHAYLVAARLHQLGMEVQAVVDRRARVSQTVLASLPQGIRVMRDAAIVQVHGAKSVSSVTIFEAGKGRQRLDADLVCSAGGATPNVNLFSQAGGSLRWLDESAMFIPDRRPAGVAVVGSCAGVFDAETAIEHATAIGSAAAIGNERMSAIPTPEKIGIGIVLADNRPHADWLPSRPGKAFVDLQHDVAASDIELAARENYRSVEHLKRYTTTGMGTDQGKTSNINALVQMGIATGRAPDAVGTTKFRPPYKPVTLGLLAAGRSGLRLRPSKRLPAHDWHLAHGAVMEEFGVWQRPAYYPQPGESMEQSARREVRAVRNQVGIFDGSPLGKIEVHGPDAAAFLDWMYLGTMSTLKVGQGRYGAMLTETGILMDDGIVVRLADDHFWVNASSGGADRVAFHMEDWLQRDLQNLRVSVTPVTAQWGNLTLAGPKAWEVLKVAGFPQMLAPDAMAHMTARDITWSGIPVKVLRASFNGELGYELNVPARYTRHLYERIWQAGQAFGITMYGVEALQVMRVEKGYIHVGTDSDGASYPDDVGLIRGPIKKASDFVGRRSLSLPVATDTSRQQLVGLIPVDRRSHIVVGAHITDASPPSLSQGFVTSSCFSEALGHPIALARLSKGRSRIGEHIKVFNMDTWVEAEVVPLPFLDPKGERLHAR